MIKKRGRQISNSRRLAETNNARLTVVMLLQRIPPYLARLAPKCPCPVCLIKSTDTSPIRRVMACVDFNELDASGQDTAEPLLEMAGSLALHEGSEFHIACAWKATGENVLRRSRTSPNGAETYDSVKPHTHLRKGPAGEVVSALSRELEVDLIVVGTVARTGIPGLLIGNTAETVLNAASRRAASECATGC